ncbi:MAG: sugar transferase [Candidatus Pacebacteria bacterium]|nr:sugar transferase [Candidatus Paceibacterota bacterium]
MIYTVLRVPLDFCALIGAGIATYIIRTNILDSWRPVQFAPELPLSRFMLLIVGVSLWFVLVYAVSGLYSMKQRMSLAQEVARSLVASSAAMMGVILTIFLRAEAFNSRFLVLGYWIIAMTCVVVGRITMHSLIRYATARYGVAVRRLLLIGNDAVTQQLSEALRADRGLGYRIEAELQHPDMEAVSRLVSQGGIDEVILATPDYPAQGIVELVEFCHEHHVSFKFVPNIYQTLTTHYDVDAIGRIPLVQLRRTALEGWGRVFKAILDRVGSLFALLILAIPMLAIGFCIKWETAGPLFVRLNRVSRGRTFGLYKFRSMIENAEELKPMLAQYNERSDGPLFKMRDDPRVTRVGRILRRTRLDELPQLLNVLRGDMSLVGPRPHQPDEIARYQKHHRRVLDIKAGVTGLAQVSGSSSLPFEEEVQLDTFYIENWTLATDVRILVRTALKLLTDRTAV